MKNKAGESMEIYLNPRNDSFRLLTIKYMLINPYL